MSPDAQMLAAGGVDLLSVWDTESDSEKPKSIIDCSGHVVHAIWGSEDGTYLVYLVTDKRVDLHQTAAENDYSGMELDDKQANDNMIHAKLHVYHTVLFMPCVNPRADPLDAGKLTPHVSDLVCALRT